MPLTPFQEQIASLLAADRSPDSYLAGGAALHIAPTSQRYSNDLDYFQDSVERVASAFAADRARLEANGFVVEVNLQQAGFARAVVTKAQDATKVDWAHDSAWRFLPPLQHAIAGYVLHPIDLAINKLLALVGRDEPRDFLDILFAHRSILSLGALCWAGAGKDPGFTPPLLLTLLRRRGKNRPEDMARLRLREQPDVVALKHRWLEALDQAETFSASRPPAELGCLYYSRSRREFISDFAPGDPDVVPHYGRAGGAEPEP
ncbi:MAG TPA: nucleotidyl transferase AbiEii/AbiGii toxin family protein [Polyangiaceae bacterium]